MPTVLSPGQTVGTIPKISIRKQAGLANFGDWGAEKRFRSKLNQKAQSTISLCVGILLFTLFLFGLCTIDSSIVPGQPLRSSLIPESENGIAKKRSVQQTFKQTYSSSDRQGALQGMGTIYRRGMKAMNELIIAHISESTSLEEFRMFLRTLHRSGVTARADLVLLFPWSPPPASMVDVIQEEDASFQKLLRNRLDVLFAGFPAPNSPQIVRTDSKDSNGVLSNSTLSPFNFHAFKKVAEEGDSSVEPLWGWRNSNVSERRDTQSFRVMWGSVVGFEVSELNPDNALRGFIDKPPLQLRRWACYQLLLGRVRHKFKHVLLTEVGGVLVLRDPLTVARKKSGLYLSMEDRTWGAMSADELRMQLIKRAPEIDSSANSRELVDAVEQTGEVDKEPIEVDKDEQDEAEAESFEGANRLSARLLAGAMETPRKVGKRRRSKFPAGLCERVYGKQIWNSLEDSERRKQLVNSGTIVGGVHQIRGLSNAMVTEIVRVALERKNRNPFPDNVLLSYLLHKSSVLGRRVLEHLRLVGNVDSVVHSLVGSKQEALFFKKGRQAYAMIHGYDKSRRWPSVVDVVHRDICLSPVDAAVYSNCR